MVIYTKTIMDIAREIGAQLIFIGNVYNAGIPSNGVISNDAVDAPVNDKGRLRQRLEQMIATAVC